MTAARDDVLRALRARLLSGDRRELGEATAVAREALDDPGLLSLLVDCLEDGDATVVSHAAHAAMQVSRDRPDLFQPFAGRLSGILAVSPVWEIGEQLPKILARLDLDPAQAAQLQAVLERKVEAEFGDRRRLGADRAGRSRPPRPDRPRRREAGGRAGPVLAAQGGGGAGEAASGLLEPGRHRQHLSRHPDRGGPG